MRRRKLFISLLAAVIVVLNTVSLGWAAADDMKHNISILAIYIYFALYVLIIAARSINQNSVESHAESVIHLTTLTTIACLLLGGTAILPISPPPVIEATGDDYVLLPVWYTMVGIYYVICIIAFTTPQGPPLHYSPGDIYSEKTVQSITNTDQENVCGITSTLLFFRVCILFLTVAGASPWGILLFSYTTKVVWLGNVATSLDIGDLPIVPGNMRATYNYTRMKKAMHQIKLRIWSWSPRPGSGWGLAYRLLRLNILPFTAELILAAVSAVLFYAPALFLQRLVEYLEVDPDRNDPGWGWVYVIGLFLSNVISFLGVFRLLPPWFHLIIWVSYWAIVVSIDNHYSGSVKNPAQYCSLCENTGSQRRRIFCFFIIFYQQRPCIF